MRTTWLALAIALFAWGAHAQGPQKEAAEQFAAGLAHARAGQWGSALQAFEAAYRLDPKRLSALFNLAGAQLRTGKMLHAHANYHRLQERKDGALGSSHRRAIERQLKLIELRIPRLRVDVPGLRPDDRVLLDNTRLYPNELGMELWVDPGSHTLAVYRPSGKTTFETVLLTEMQHRFITLRIE